MCFTYSLNTSIKSLEARFKAVSVKQKFSNIFSVNGFTYPKMPVITSEKNNEINFYNWGLIPSWIKNEIKAQEFRKFTLNARAETIFEKPSYKDSIINKRCIIPSTGYFEWYHANKKKYPFLIYIPLHEIFSIAGIWDKQKLRSGEENYTYSIITVEADDYTSKIHNSKKRMPLILKKKDEGKWLQNNLNKTDISDLLISKKHKFDSHTVINILGKKNENSNIPEILLPYQYDDLSTQKRFF